MSLFIVVIAMCKAGKEDEALRILEQLASNATKERRYSIS